MALGARETRAGALTATLADLAEATDALTIAVERHDLAALIAANEQAEALTARINEIVAELTPLDKAELDRVRIAGLQSRLDVAARRNAYLIERAWALDAATVRLLMNLGRTDGPAAGYAAAASPANYLDRQA